MAKYRIARVLSAAALVAGSGVFAPAVWADGECVAADLEGLETCLADTESTSVTTTDTIVVSGVQKTLLINKDINGVSGKDFINVTDGASLTLRGSGIITAGRYGARVDGAELMIDGVTISATNPTMYGVYALNNGRVTMESGQVVADYAAFAGNNTTGDMNFYIHGGQLISNRYPAVYMPGQVFLEMRGGTLSGGIVARMGQITIEGGTINVQSNPVEGDGLDVNYNGMPSMANEAITLIAGSYSSTTTDYGNSMNVSISGYNTQINGDIVLYDLGNTAAGFEQNVNVSIEDGRLTGFKTKYTEEEIGFALKSGYTAGLNNDAGRINVEITGGDFLVEPAEEDLVPGYEADLNEDTGVYEVWPKQVDYKDDYLEALYGDYAVYVDFNSELIADRKADLAAETIDPSELKLTGDGELIGAIDINMVDRDGVRIEVNDVDMRVYIDIDEDTYNQLAEYDKIEAVYFDEDGNEVERLEADLNAETYDYVDPITGESETWYFYWVEFSTTHLSTYGIVGVNEESEEAAEEASAPETGVITMAGASAMNAAVVTAVVIGILTSVVSFAYLIRRR
ncbi:hypothetical protein IKG49_02070 [Candidatus Saccharibacteria bacterium]|nr:hypothetical protein [Candidatus Saccharibacteria bacterium]